MLTIEIWVRDPGGHLGQSKHTIEADEVQFIDPGGETHRAQDFGPDQESVLCINRDAVVSVLVRPKARGGPRPLFPAPAGAR